jgi:uncharacterized protein (TIGR04222 family)
MPLEADLAFLVVFSVIGFTLATLGSRRTRRLAAAWPPPGKDFDESNITGEELGLLSGGFVDGEVRAIEAAVARLHVVGLLTYDTARRALVAPHGAAAHDGTALSAAVLAAVADGVPMDVLTRDARVRAALRGLFASLGRRALPAGGKWYESGLPPGYFTGSGWPALLFGLAGFVWVLIPPHRWYTIVPTVVVALVLCGWAAHIGEDRKDLPTMGRRAFDRVKARNTHLDPAMNPALATYGPAAAALAVGLFGMAALSATDPALAALPFAAMAPVPSTASSTSRTDMTDGAPDLDTGFGCGGGDSCGGGSCGGGSCGANSCGG